MVNFNTASMVQLTVDNTCSNILVRGVNWIGDAVMTMPAIRSMKVSCPDARITLLVKPWVAPLFEKDPHIDEIIVYGDEHKGISGKLKLARLLRKKAFCRAVLLQNALDAAIVSLLARIPERIGYNRDGRGVLLTKSIRYDDHAKKLHHIKYYLNLLDQSGFDTVYSTPWSYLDLKERIEARQTLSTMKRPLVALNPGATYGSSKRWPSDRFADLAQGIIDQVRGSVVVLGGPSETSIAGEIASMVRGQYDEILVMAGKTSLRQLMALVSECDVLVTNDSGPMHIGYSVGTPLVAIFGSTSPEMTGPVGGGSLVVRQKVDCAPCFERECTRNDLQCMNAVSVQDVFDAIKKLLFTNRAVFFDRDGTLCKDVNYLNKMEDFELYPSIGRLSKLKEKGFRLVGISNQSGIARGLVNEDFVKEVHNIFTDEYGFDGFYYCPHHPDEYCPCRKPEPGMLMQARVDHGINLRESFVVGDKDADMMLARSVGARGVFMETGKEQVSPHADFRARDFKEAVKIVVEAQGNS